MKRASMFAMVAGVLLVSASAFADPDPDPNAGGGAAAPPAAAPAAAPMGAGMDSAPLVVPTGSLSVFGSVPILRVSITDPVSGTTASSTSEALLVGAQFGAIDKLEVGGSYAHGLHPSDGNGTLSAYGTYQVLHNDKLDVAVNVNLELPLDSGSTDSIGIGLWARYHVAPKISVFTGNPGLPHNTLFLGGSLLVPGTDQLQIGLNNGNSTILSIPVGVGFQASPQLYAYLSTTIAGIGIHPSGGNIVIFSDFIPIGVGAWYAVNDKLDVGGEFSDDFKNAGDFYAFAINARYKVK